MIITNGRIFSNGKWLREMDLVIEKGRVNSIVPKGSVDDNNVVDVKGNLVCPGFVDIHIHGCVGCDVMDGEIDSIKRMARFIASHGTTSFLPTTMTFSIEGTHKSLQAVNDYMNCESTEGAEALGVHLEGPFISPGAKGAQIEEYILSPNMVNYNLLVSKYGSIIKHITVAPEMEGAHDLIRDLSNMGISVSAGHTQASYDECIKGFECGICHATHFYNAMSPLHHRNPGMVGAVLDNENITTEIICDLIHVHPVAIRLPYNIKGAKNIALITDSMAATGLGDGEYELGGQKVFVNQGVARLKEGNLAGSTLTQDRALKNVVKLGIPLEDGVAMLTETPSHIIGVDSYKGKIEKGYDADFTILNDDLDVVMTIVGGNLVYKAI